MSFFRKVSPTGAAKDFAQVWSGNPYRWRVLAVSIGATACLMAIIIPKSERIPPEKPRITYITSFAAGRTDAEIKASNIANEKRQEVVRAQEKKREEFRKSLYRELGRATGVDVDAMERKIKQDEAAEKAALEKRAQEAKARAEAGAVADK